MYSPYRKNSYRLRSDNYGLYSNKIDSYNDYSDNSRIDSYGAYSSYGGGCCDPVVDPLTYAALLGFLALATYFFQVLIEMSMLEMMLLIKLNSETMLEVTLPSCLKLYSD